MNDLCTDPVNGCCADNCQPKFPVNMTDVRVCGEGSNFGNASDSEVNATYTNADTYYYEVEPYFEYVLLYGFETPSPRRFVVRANGECGTRLLDTGYVGRVPSLATCQTKSAPCCVKTGATDEFCTGAFNQTCPGRYVNREG